MKAIKYLIVIAIFGLIFGGFGIVRAWEGTVSIIDDRIVGSLPMQ